MFFLGWVENIVGKGMFSFSYNVFKSLLFQGRSYSGLCGKELTLFTTQPRLLMTLRKKTFENIMTEGENAGKPRFPLFP